jgi:rfaE bifunctional protein nucleotidyltransferase chain/domain
MALIIKDFITVRRIRLELRAQSMKIVFTNGCFDLLHRGHMDLLEKAKALGDVLILGLNTDESIRRIKGPKRPLVPLEDRAYILSKMAPIDLIVPFGEDTPERIIDCVIPDILVKGSDWKDRKIVGRETVEEAGGQVITIDLVPGLSTTNLIKIVTDRFSRRPI